MTTCFTVEGVCPRPTSMTIEVTSYCSLKCVGCARTIGKAAGLWEDRHMSAALFERICDHLPPLERLTLHGIGEPTLNPDYPAIVQTAARSGRFTVIGANTHAMTRSPEYYQRLVDLGMNELYVSVDSLTQEVADRTRAGTRVDQLRDRLESFARMGLAVRITVVASRFNLHDLPATLDALDAIGPCPVFIQEFVDLGRPEGCLTVDDRNVLAAILRAGEARWGRLSLHGTLSLSDGWQAPPICADPWTGFGVTVDGFLTPCCMMWNPAELGFLNLAECSLEAALRSPQYLAFLGKYLAEAPSFCDGCQKNARPVATPFVPLLRHPVAHDLRQAG